MRYLLIVVASVTLFAEEVRLDGPIWATAIYLGGSGNDAPSRAKVDAFSNVYVIGGTDSPELPRQFLIKAAPSGAIIYAASLFDPRFATAPGTLTDLEVARDGTAWVLRDRFNLADVIKIDPAGSQVFSVTLGQPVSPAAPFVAVRGGALAVEPGGAAWVAGNTSGGIALLRIAADGAISERANVAGAIASDMTLDAAGNIYLVGSVDAETLPTHSRSVQQRYNGGNCAIGGPNPPPVPCRDAFLVKLDPQGGLLYATYFGGTSHDGATRVAVDRTGAAVLAGFTGSEDLPIRDAIQPRCRPGDGFSCGDAFVAKIDAAGRLVFSTFLGGSFSEAINGLAVDDRGIVYVAGRISGNELPLYRPPQRANGGGPVLASADGGRTWNAGAGVPATTARQFAWGGGPLPRLYVATDRGVFWSADGGQTWNNEPGVPDDDVRSVSADPTSRGTVYAAVGFSGIFKSTDGGRTWASSPGLRPGRFDEVAVAPSSPLVVYANGAEGLFRSADGGASWLQVRGPGLGKIVVHPTDPTVFWATDFSRVVRLRHSGATLEPTAPLPSYSPFLNQIRAVAFDGTNANIVYVGQTSGVSRTVDGGHFWQPLTTRLPAALGSYDLAVDLADSNVVYALNAGLYRMLVNRGAWELVTERLPDTFQVREVSANGRHIVVGTTAGNDAFVLGLTGSGRLLWSTYIGGVLEESAVGVDVHGRTVHVIGSTASPAWALAAQSGPPHAGGRDMFWARLRDPIGR
jgi:photosystem II stability/assembly factor-like uncharacterized protein